VKKIETQRRIIYAIVPLTFYPPSSLSQMGSSSSKSSSSSSGPATASAEIESAFADMFADAMERADWHGKRKPTWQQSHDHFVVQMRAGAPVVA
jgi:hypothetical protein